MTKPKNAPPAPSESAAALDDDTRNVLAQLRYLPQRYEARVVLDRLVDFPGNPKEHDVGGIVESMRTNGVYGAVLVQERKSGSEKPGRILSGHGRKKSLLEEGATHVDVIWVTCDDATAKAIVLAENKLVERGGYDDNRLLAFLEPIARAGRLAGTGYDGDDVDALRDFLTPPSFTPDDAGAAPGRLDQVKRVTCPECGHTFTAKPHGG